MMGNTGFPATERETTGEKGPDGLIKGNYSDGYCVSGHALVHALNDASSPPPHRQGEEKAR
jgi:hypothetical protein